jgi:hypothetical protein
MPAREPVQHPLIAQTRPDWGGVDSWSDWGDVDSWSDWGGVDSWSDWGDVDSWSDWGDVDSWSDWGDVDSWSDWGDVDSWSDWGGVDSWPDCEQQKLRLTVGAQLHQDPVPTGVTVPTAIPWVRAGSLVLLGTT